MVYNDINQAEVVVYDKVREYFKADKKLGGLIKVFTTQRSENLGRTIDVCIPFLDIYDEVRIDGHPYAPHEGKPS